MIEPRPGAKVFDRDSARAGARERNIEGDRSGYVGHVRKHRRSFGGCSLRGPLLALAAALALLALGASSASGVIMRLRNGSTLSYQPLRGLRAVIPFDAFFSNLDYSGGPVMAQNTNYAFYWAPPGAPAYPPDYQPGLNQYFEDLAHDSGGHENVDSVSSQYNDAAGEFASYNSHFGGVIIDTNPYPPNGCKQAAICLTDAQLRTELSTYVAVHKLPRDLLHEYFLLTPPGVEDCFESSGRACSAGSTSPVYCAYHSDISLPEGVIVYASDPYVTGNEGCDDRNHPNGSSSDGALQGGLSHEHIESITDPEPNNAWRDIGGSGGEIGDKCAGNSGVVLGKASNGANYNQLINGHLYWYQQEWSNQGHRCLQRLSFSGEEPTATFSYAPMAGNVVSLDASGSIAPGGVADYNWQFNDRTKAMETNTPTVSHEFLAGGVYLVALTVFAPDGTSIATARMIAAGKVPPPALTALTPEKGNAGGGTLVTVKGVNFFGATAVRFGTTAAASFKVNSPTSISAWSAAAVGGVIDVTVTTPGGTSLTSLRSHFKLLPSVTGVSPSTGSRAGGTTVTITGTGFAPGEAATGFTFGATRAKSVKCTSETSCRALTPPHAVGTVNLKAIVNTVASPRSPSDQFTYQ